MPKSKVKKLEKLAEIRAGITGPSASNTRPSDEAEYKRSKKEKRKAEKAERKELKAKERAQQRAQDRAGRPWTVEAVEAVESVDYMSDGGVEEEDEKIPELVPVQKPKSVVITSVAGKDISKSNVHHQDTILEENPLPSTKLTKKQKRKLKLKELKKQQQQQEISATTPSPSTTTLTTTEERTSSVTSTIEWGDSSRTTLISGEVQTLSSSTDSDFPMLFQAIQSRPKFDQKTLSTMQPHIPKSSNKKKRKQR